MAQFKVFCTSDPTSEVTWYCETHREAICDTYRQVGHRKCKVTPLEEKGATYNVSQIQTVIENLQKFKDEIERFQQGRDDDCKRVEEMVEMTRQEIKTLRTDLNIYLDKLENDLMNELEEKAKNLREEVDQILPTCTAVLKVVENDTKLLNEATQSSNVSMVFAADIRISKRLDDLESMIRDLQDSAKSQFFEFKANEQLLNLEEDVKNFGTVRVVKSQNFSIRRIKSSREVRVQLPNKDDDYRHPCIAGCVFMEDGQLLLSDRANSNVKLLDSTFEIKGHLALESEPWGIAALDPKIAVVTLPDDKQLQFIQVSPSLVALETIQLDHEFYGVDVVDGEIYVVCYRSDTEVHVLDSKGRYIRKIADPQDALSSLSQPYDLAVNRYLSHIYLSDLHTSVLTCLTLNGTLVYETTYKEDYVAAPMGVIADEQGNVLVCGRDSCSIHIITANGQNHSILYTTEQPTDEDSCKDCGCYSMAYRVSDRTLVIGLNQANMGVLQLA